MIILEPTRELANQVAQDIKDITDSIYTTCLYGGAAYSPQGKLPLYVLHHEKTKTQISSVVAAQLISVFVIDPLLKSGAILDLPCLSDILLL